MKHFLIYLLLSLITLNSYTQSNINYTLNTSKSLIAKDSSVAKGRMITPLLISRASNTGENTGMGLKFTLSDMIFGEFLNSIFTPYVSFQSTKMVSIIPLKYIGDTLNMDSTWLPPVWWVLAKIKNFKPVDTSLLVSKGTYNAYNTQFTNRINDSIVNLKLSIAHLSDSINQLGDTVRVLKNNLNTLVSSTGIETVNRTIYVDATKSDSNDGTTAATAFATITKALSTIKSTVNSTITVNIAAGTYSLTQDIFSLLTRFNGNGGISLTGTLSNISSISLASNTDGSHYRTISTYGGISPNLTANVLMYDFLNTGSTYYPIIGNTATQVKYYSSSMNESFTQVYSIGTLLNITQTGTLNSYFDVRLKINLTNLNINYVNNNICNVYYPYLTIKNCILTLGTLNLAYSSPVINYSILKVNKLQLTGSISAGVSYNVLYPLSSATTYRIYLNGGTFPYNFQQNYIENLPSQRSTVGAISVAYCKYPKTSSGFISCKNTSYVVNFSGNETDLSPFENEKLYVDSVNSIYSCSVSSYYKNRLILSRSNIYDSKTGVVSTYPYSIYNSDFVSKIYDPFGTNLFFKGEYFQPIEQSLSSTCTYNSSITIPIASTTYNSQVEISYTVLRGTNSYSGKLTIVPGTSLWYKNEVFGDGNTYGITMVPQYDATKTTQINWVITSSSLDTNTTTINYNVNRIMK